MIAEPMLVQADDYYWKMSARHRLILVDEGRTAYCTFFILNNLQEVAFYHTRPIWSTPEDTETGSILFIDKLLAKHFNRALWREIEQVLTTQFPQWKQAVWYRPGRDADCRYTYRRRLSHGANL